MERFWSKVKKTDGCWTWTATKQKGYGRFWFEDRLELAHRVAWILCRGRIPAGDHYGTTCVLHRCDNPSCVNPDHLFLGSNQDNITDKVQKCRHEQGERHSRSKLSDLQVRVIRRYAFIGCRELSRMFNVNSSTMSRLLTRKTWRHI